MSNMLPTNRIRLRKIFFLLLLQFQQQPFQDILVNDVYTEPGFFSDLDCIIDFQIRPVLEFLYPMLKDTLSS